MNEPGSTPAFFVVLKSVSGRLSQFINLTGKELGRMGRRSALQERDVVASDQGVSQQDETLVQTEDSHGVQRGLKITVKNTIT